jgi:hypothetical protein
MERNPSASGIVQDQTNMNTKWPDPSHYEEAYDDDDDDDDDDDLNYSNDDYYSNESDILDDDTFNVDGEDLFDVDFPHEQDDDLIHPNFNTQKLPSSPPLYNGGMVSVPSQQQTYNHGSSYHQQQRPNSMSPTFTDTTANGMTRHFSLQMKPSSSTLPRSISMYAPSTRSSLDDTNYSTPQQRITVDTSITYQPQPQLQQTPTSSISGIPSFSFDKMDEFVKFHRAEIREITDCTKKETKLVANISLDLSSNFDDQQQQNDHKSQSQFVKYLRDLDEILDRKLAAVEALRDRINDTVSQVEL